MTIAKVFALVLLATTLSGCGTLCTLYEMLQAIEAAKEVKQ